MSQLFSYVEVSTSGEQDVESILGGINGVYCWHRERLYFATGYGLIQCVKAMMSYENEVSFPSTVVPWCFIFLD